MKTVVIDNISSSSDNNIIINDILTISNINNTNNNISGFPSSIGTKSSLFLKRTDNDTHVQINAKLSENHTYSSLFLNGSEIVTASNIIDIATNFVNTEEDLNLTTTGDLNINISSNEVHFFDEGDSGNEIMSVKAGDDEKYGLYLHRNLYMSCMQYSIGNDPTITFDPKYVLHIFNMNTVVGVGVDVTCQVPDPSHIGQVLQLIFTKSSESADKKLTLDFDGEGLGSLNAYNSRYLEFTKTGQSCNLISIGQKWTILGTGGDIKSG